MVCAMSLKSPRRNVLNRKNHQGADAKDDIGAKVIVCPLIRHGLQIRIFYEIITIYAIAIFFFSHKKKFPVVGSKICSHLKVEVFIEEKPKGHCDYTESQKPQDEVDSEHQKLGMNFYYTLSLMIQREKP